MHRKLVVLAAVIGLLVLAGGVAMAVTPPALEATGPTSVAGTPATGVFQLGDETIRQVRYVDRGTLLYTFRLRNEGQLPVRVTGLVSPATPHHLFRFLRLTDGSGATHFSVPGGGSRTVSLALRMTGCETLSARAGTLVPTITVRAGNAPGWAGHEVTVGLPEALRTGSPREAGCANSTATSRPPG